MVMRQVKFRLYKSYAYHAAIRELKPGWHELPDLFRDLFRAHVRYLIITQIHYHHDKFNLRERCQ